MVAALKDMLAAASLPLDLERQDLLDRSLALAEQLKQERKRLASAQQVRTVLQRRYMVDNTLPCPYIPSDMLRRAIVIPIKSVDTKCGSCVFLFNAVAVVVLVSFSVAHIKSVSRL
jgi:hypothetical protein